MLNEDGLYRQLEVLRSNDPRIFPVFPGPGRPAPVESGEAAGAGGVLAGMGKRARRVSL